MTTTPTDHDAPDADATTTTAAPARPDRLMPILLGLDTLLGLLILPWMPDTVPVHWNARGEPDNFGPGWINALLAPIVGWAIWGLMKVVPRLDPRRRNYRLFGGAYRTIRDAFVVMIIGLHLVVLAKTFEAHLPVAVDIGLFVTLLVGGLFVVTGNVLSQVRPNYFVGIRTPWTLDNEAVWRKTHRLGGALFVIAGLAMMATSFLGEVAFIVMLVVVFAAVIVPIVASYIWYRRIADADDTAD
jgi:uncharacterized membrane protein